MKKLFLSVMCLMLVSANVCLAKDKVVKTENLPVAVQQFVKNNFPKTRIVSATQESDDLDYNLSLSNGTKLEFDKTNKWSEIINGKGLIPSSLIPAGVKNYVRLHYPHKAIISIERSSQGYDIDLSSHKHFQLNKSFKPAKFTDAD
jgi:hypothetical protein